MARRFSIDIGSGLIANRRGPFVVSGEISGADPRTGAVSRDFDEQCRQMFENVGLVMQAAGGTPDDILKINVRIIDRALRATIDRQWAEIFPEADSRPALQVTWESEMGLLRWLFFPGFLRLIPRSVPSNVMQCDFMAVIDD